MKYVKVRRLDPRLGKICFGPIFALRPTNMKVLGELISNIPKLWNLTCEKIWVQKTGKKLETVYHFVNNGDILALHRRIGYRSNFTQYKFFEIIEKWWISLDQLISGHQQKLFQRWNNTMLTFNDIIKSVNRCVNCYVIILCNIIYVINKLIFRLILLEREVHHQNWQDQIPQDLELPEIPLSIPQWFQVSCYDISW